MAKHYVLSESARAAVQMGAKPEDVGAQEVDETLEHAAEATPEASEAPAVEANAEPQGEAPKPEQAPQTNAGGELVSYLQSQVEKRDERIEKLLTDLNQSKAEATRLAGAEQALAPIAAEAIQRMQVALGQAPSKLDGMSATVLSETYASVKEEFNSRFKVGRASMEATEETRTPRDRGLERLQLVQ